MIKWRIFWEVSALKTLKSLDKIPRLRIQNYLKTICNTGEPLSYGRALTGDKKALWRYRVGKYRIICKIETRALIIKVIKIGNRDAVYK